jgi:hypothetical protein
MLSIARKLMWMEFEREPNYFVGEIIDCIKNYEDGG